MKLIKIIVILLLLLTMVPTTTKAAPTYFVGTRQVPGPIPPNWWDWPAVDTQIGLVYGQANGVDLLLDFGKPQMCQNQKVPLVVYVHGGWWVAGSRSGMVTSGYACMYYQLGIAFASIDYRFTPAYQYKDIIGDCKLAIRYLRANADTLGIDPDKIAIWGGSAGGHLVSLMGTAGDNDGLEGQGYPGVSSRPAAVANDCGIEDLTTPWDATSDMVISWFLGCQASVCPDKAKEASPAWQASPDDPPILTLHGDHDPTVAYSQALALNKSLKSVGNKGAFICVVNGDHGFGPYTAGVTVTPDWVRQIYLRFYHLLRYIEPGLFCDLNVDGQVNLTDANVLDSLMGVYGINTGGLPTTPLWNSQADTYSDGRIDYKDWQTYSKVSPLPPKFSLELIPSTQVVGGVRIQIKNPGQLDIRNYTVTLNFPSQLALKSSSESVAVNGQTVTYTNSLLSAGQTKNVDLVFVASKKSLLGDVFQFALSSNLSAPEDILPVDSSAKIQFPTATLWLGSSIMRARAGEKPTFTAVARNTSKLPVSNAKLWIDIPKELEFLSSVPQGARAGSKASLDIGNMAPGSSIVFKIETKISSGFQEGNIIVNTGLESDQTDNLFDSAIVQVYRDIPGSNPELAIKWIGIDTKTSTGQTGVPVQASVSITGGTSPYEVSISWGDGNTSQATIKNTESKILTNAFYTSGRYEIMVTVLDNVMRQKVIKRVVSIR